MMDRRWIVEATRDEYTTLLVDVLAPIINETVSRPDAHQGTLTHNLVSPRGLLPSSACWHLCSEFF